MAMLIDAFGREMTYLRLSVTDRCDLRCAYCLPVGFRGYQEPGDWLTFDEIERLVGVFAAGGLRRIRLTGGEPLLRRDLTGLVRRLAALPGMEELSLSTNGTRLAAHAAQLRRAGIVRLNVSLDSLDRERVRTLCQRDVLPDVLAGLEAARQEGFAPIKINMVAMATTSDDEIDAMVAFCQERGFVLRLIETMPMGDTGRAMGFRDLRPIQERLRHRFGLIDELVSGSGPARYLVSADRQFQVGFITPMSQHFCAACNRLRLSVDGRLYLCLGHEDSVDFRQLLRGGGSDADLRAALLEGLRRKPERHDFTQQPEKTVRVMAATGG